MSNSKQSRVGAFIRGAGSWLLTMVATAILFLAVVLAVIPHAYGGLSLTVLSGSMQPSIDPGDVVVTKPFEPMNATDLNVGDVITFLPYPNDPTLVTHRIVGKSFDKQGNISFVTQGDDNDSVDPWGPVLPKQIRGELLYVVPKIGYLRQWAGERTELLLLGTAVGLIGFGFIIFATSWRKPCVPEKPDGGPDEDEPVVADVPDVPGDGFDEPEVEHTVRWDTLVSARE
jgi:signal peptidase